MDNIIIFGGGDQDTHDRKRQGQYSYACTQYRQGCPFFCQDELHFIYYYLIIITMIIIIIAIYYVLLAMGGFYFYGELFNYRIIISFLFSVLFALGVSSFAIFFSAFMTH